MVGDTGAGALGRVNIPNERQSPPNHTSAATVAVAASAKATTHIARTMPQKRTQLRLNGADSGGATRRPRGVVSAAGAAALAARSSRFNMTRAESAGAPPS